MVVVETDLVCAPCILVVEAEEPTVADLPAMLLHVVVVVLVVLARPTQSQVLLLDSVFQELVT
jgi:hypothetical protein